MDGLDRRDLLLAVLVTLAVFLTGAAAASLYQAEHGPISTPDDDAPVGGERIDLFAESDFPSGLFIAIVIVFAGIAVIAQFVGHPKRTFLRIIGLSVIVAFLFELFNVLRGVVSVDPPEIVPPPSNLGTPPPTPENTSDFGQGEPNSFVIPEGDPAGIVILAGLLGIVVFLAWRSGSIQTVIASLANTQSDEIDESLDAVGDLAGQVADTVEAATSARAADNAIFRAWREMVDLLDAADPQSATPRQFAATAIEAGMDQEDVTVLTETFEEVRYGDAPLSQERRERAVAALRRIEQTHGSTDADTETDSDEPDFVDERESVRQNGEQSEGSG